MYSWRAVPTKGCYVDITCDYTLPDGRTARIVHRDTLPEMRSLKWHVEYMIRQMEHFLNGHA